jgi:hypothetical protein
MPALDGVIDAGKSRDRAVEMLLDPEELAALDAWIARSPDPKPSRADAARRVLVGALGGRLRSSAVPGIVTGRDIFE